AMPILWRDPISHLLTSAKTEKVTKGKGLANKFKLLFSIFYAYLSVEEKVTFPKCGANFETTLLFDYMSFIRRVDSEQIDSFLRFYNFWNILNYTLVEFRNLLVQKLLMRAKRIEELTVSAHFFDGEKLHNLSNVLSRYQTRIRKLTFDRCNVVQVESILKKQEHLNEIEFCGLL